MTTDNSNSLLNNSRKTTKKIPLTIAFQGDVFSRIELFRKDMGLNTCQDVIRLSVAYFLRENGYDKK